MIEKAKVPLDLQPWPSSFCKGNHCSFSYVSAFVYNHVVFSQCVLLLLLLTCEHLRVRICTLYNFIFVVPGTVSGTW